MTIRGRIALSLITAGMTVAGWAFAHESIEAIVAGENICVGCTLKKEQGAGAQCGIYGHKHALLVTDATVGGKNIPDMKGWVLHYLETQKSENLIKQHHGENLTITGKVYPDEHVLEVTSFTSTSQAPQTEGSSIESEHTHEHSKESEHHNGAEHPGGEEHHEHPK